MNKLFMMPVVILTSYAGNQYLVKYNGRNYLVDSKSLEYDDQEKQHYIHIMELKKEHTVR